MPHVLVNTKVIDYSKILPLLCLHLVYPLYFEYINTKKIKVKKTIFLFLILGTFLYSENTGIVSSKRAIGCESKVALSDAYDAFVGGGLMGFSTYNKRKQCLILFEGAEVTILKKDMPHYKIIYKNPYGKQRIFWVSYDVVK